MPYWSEPSSKIQLKPLLVTNAEQSDIQLFTFEASSIVDLIEAAEALIGLVRKFDKNTYENVVSKRLENIYLALLQIIDELNKFKEYLRTLLNEEFRNFVGTAVYATKKDFDNELSFLTPGEIKNPPTATKEKIAALAARQRSNSFQLHGYGPAAYFAVGAAALSTLAMWQFIRVRPSGLKQFVGETVSWLRKTIDPKEPGSFGDAYARFRKIGDDHRGYFETAEADIWLGYYTATRLAGYARPIDDPRDRPEREIIYVNWYAAKHGDFDAGMQYAPSRHVADGQNPFRHPLSRIEGGAELHDRDESGRARARNLTQHFSDARAQAILAYARAAEIQQTIVAIEKLIELLERIADDYGG